MVGYNEIALLRKMIKSLTDKQVAICVESLCNTQQYAEYLTRPFGTSKKNKKWFFFKIRDIKIIINSLNSD